MAVTSESPNFFSMPLADTSVSREKIPTVMVIDPSDSASEKSCQLQCLSLWQHHLDVLFLEDVPFLQRCLNRGDESVDIVLRTSRDNHSRIHWITNYDLLVQSTPRAISWNDAYLCRGGGWDLGSSRGGNCGHQE